MKKLNKKGIELQVNFLVILILTLVIFGASMAIAYKVLKKTDELKGQVDATTQARLESLLVTGNEEVVIPFNKIDNAVPGQPQTFALGILNKLDTASEFKVKVTPSREIDSNGGDQGSHFADEWVFSYKTEESIGILKNNEHKIVSIIVLVPKNGNRESTYIFDVKVSYKNNAGEFKDYPTTNSVKKIRITTTN